ncbi:tetratricopeptide repeat protein [bacterium]|nr:tetratricopeptide repeat protein [bacterium]
MTKLHRRDLKQDEVRTKVAEAVKSVSLHGREVLYIIIIVIAVAAIAFSWFFYEKRQQEASQNLLGQGLEKFNSPVGPQTDPNTPKPVYNFNSDAEKYSAAAKDFEKVIADYGNTPAADMARYLAGVCYFYMKDFAKSEQNLKQSTKISDRNLLYYQSRMALADLYSKTNKPDQAITSLKEALKPNKPQVPVEYLWLQLAETYEKAGKKKDARETYQKIVNEYKDSAVSFEAQQKLNQVQ